MPQERRPFPERVRRAGGFLSMAKASPGSPGQERGPPSHGWALLPCRASELSLGSPNTVRLRVTSTTRNALGFDAVVSLGQT